jgi:hypothetical protein
VEHFAKITLVTHLLGRQQLLSPEDVGKLMTAREKYEGNHSSASLPPGVCSGKAQEDYAKKR